MLSLRQRCPLLRLVAVFAVLFVVCPAFAQGSGTSEQTPDQIQAQARQDLAHGKSPEAIAALERMARTNPNQPRVQHDLGVAYYRAGKLVQARQAFERALVQDPGDLESMQLQGLTLYRLGQPAAAIPYLQRLQQFSPEANADASQVLALCFLNSGKLDEARAALAAEYGLPPNSAGAYLVLARMLLITNLPEQGGESAKKALSIAPNLPLAHFVLGEVALYKSDVDRAVTEFEAERALNPGYPPVYERLGDAYLRANKPEQAQQALMQSLALDTSSTGPFILLGKVLLRRDDPENAAMYLRHAEKMDPSNPIAHTLLGQAYRRLGQEAEAKQELDAAASIHAANQLKLPAANQQ